MYDLRPTVAYGVTVFRVEFNATTDAPCLLAGNKRRAGAAEHIEVAVLHFDESPTR